MKHKNPSNVLLTFFQYIEKNVKGHKIGISLDEYLKSKKLESYEINLLDDLTGKKITESKYISIVDNQTIHNRKKLFRLSSEGSLHISSYKDSFRNKLGFYFSIIALIVSILLNFYFFDAGKKDERKKEFKEISRYFNSILFESGSNRSAVKNNRLDDITFEISNSCVSDPRFLKIIGSDYLYTQNSYVKRMRKFKRGECSQEEALHAICILQRLTQAMIYASGVMQGPNLFADSVIIKEFKSNDLKKCENELQKTINMSKAKKISLSKSYREFWDSE